MRAAAIDRFGSPRVLKVRRLPVPEIAPGEVLIALEAAGVGSWDSQMRAGWWPGGRPKFPLVLGTDGAGVVAAVGSRVRRLRRGQRVYAYNFVSSKGGFYAEYVAVPAEKVGRVPRGLDLLHAGAGAVTGLTALQGVDDALKIRKGESVIIHGASGGVGTLAIQFAKRRGARVFATASGKDGVAAARRLGADEAVDGKRTDITAAARRFAPDGVDAVLAFTGRKLPECLDALRRGGRFAYPEGVEPAPRKRRGVKTVSYNAEAGVREFERLGRAITEARLKVPIAAVYPLAAAWKAHRHVDTGHFVGKIVLRIRGGTS
jgi:NADPH:quinone reductase-like Zn-dependent oxidoreductase